MISSGYSWIGDGEGGVSYCRKGVVRRTFSCFARQAVEKGGWDKAFIESRLRKTSPILL